MKQNESMFYLLDDIKEDYKRNRKIKFIYIFSIIGFFFLLIYSFIQFHIYKNNVMAYIDIICVVILIINLLLFRILKKVELSATVVLNVYFIFLASGIIVNGYKNIGISWIFTFPFFAYFLKGRLIGSLYVFAFLLSIISIIILKVIGLLIINYNIDIFINLISILIFFTLITFFYEDTTNKTEDAIKKQFYTNVLTDLPNRIQLIKDLQLMKDYKLILINIDDFKAINDLYGSEIGDFTLIELSKRLKHFYQDKRIFKIYKLHADEFALLLVNIENDIEVIDIAKEIHRILTAGLTIKNIEIIISISIGIASGERDILADADMALKKAKELKKDYIIFNDSMHMIEEYEKNLTWIRKLEKSIAYDGIVPFYQPIMNNKTGKIIKYECLVRLLSNGEIISPYLFLDVAKKSKIYSHITKMVVLKSFNYFKDKKYDFSINISLDDILNDDTVDFITSLIKEYNISEKVIFELMETKRIENNQKVNDFIKNMKNHGCKIAIDDFGSGYSNFDYILRINVDYIKIDSSLIRNIVVDKSSQIITETIVDFTKKLKIKTIAEYVNSKNIFEKVKDLKIDYSQGFYIGKPEPII